MGQHRPLSIIATVLLPVLLFTGTGFFLSAKITIRIVTETSNSNSVDFVVVPHVVDESPQSPKAASSNSSVEANTKKKTKTGVKEDATTVSDYPDVCFYSYTPVYVKPNSTKEFAMTLLTILRDSSIRSLNEIFTGNAKLNVLVPISTYKPHFSSLEQLYDFLRPAQQQYTNIHLDFAAQAAQNARDRFSQTNCSWVVVMGLDADDVVVPGYLDWIATDVIPSLPPTHRGALVATRQIRHMTVGFGRCQLELYGGNMFWAGWPVGQARIFRRSVFQALNMPFEAVNHSGSLRRYRQSVVSEILKVRQPQSLKSQLKKDFDFMNGGVDKEQEKLTGVRMIETNEAGFGTAGIRLKTPLSSHFNFNNIVSMEMCNKARWAELMTRAMDQNKREGATFDYLYDVCAETNLSLVDVCKSSPLFLLSTTTHDTFRGITCEEKDEQFRLGVANFTQSTPTDPQSV